MVYSVGTVLKVGDNTGKIVGYIEYYNPGDDNKTWIEYRVKGPTGEWWLSCDECYNEYSVSYPANDVKGRIGPEWHEVDRGTQIVKRYVGDVDVDLGETADFVEYEDATEEYTLSVEMWSDGTEYSKGQYYDLDEIIKTGYEAPGNLNSSKAFFNMISAVTIFIFVLVIGSSVISYINSQNKISKFLKNTSVYTYKTSITGNEKQTADVYSCQGVTTDYVAKNIIDAIEGDTESVTQKDDTADSEIAIVTSKEYCLIYHSEENPSEILIQVSSRKYNYTSDNAPYKSSSSDTSWYRSHYYSSGYSKDSSTYSSSKSAYNMYSGDTVHNIGNGYFDSYSKSVKQSSVNSRSSSGGGLSSGK